MVASATFAVWNAVQDMLDEGGRGAGDAGAVPSDEVEVEAGPGLERHSSESVTMYVLYDAVLICNVEQFADGYLWAIISTCFEIIVGIVRLSWGIAKCSVLRGHT
ncbi:hypothetical protein BDZ91DRAFT_739581 [Kalaharituber pfeilii]|nr:hypothetical protein BDZ91DRAFT_739581 [Kalaharituber pfeilii]